MKIGGLGIGAVLGAVRELRGASVDPGPIVVDGSRNLVPLLARELRAGGEAGAVREGGSLEHVAALVWIGEADEQALHAAAKAKVPIIAVTEADHLAYVLDTDIVRIASGAGFPIDEIAVALARRLGVLGVHPAARLPVLRKAVVDELIRSSSRTNGLIGAAVFVPGVDFPVLTLNQVHLVSNIARAYGFEIDRARAIELLGVVGTGFGLRAVAREALDFVPVAGWALKGAIAYSGTKAIGEAARAHFAARTPA